jgi:alpha(1,3/1,4) fucosyltransferase
MSETLFPPQFDPLSQAHSARQRVRIGISRFWPGATPEQVIDLLLCDLKPDFEFDTASPPDVVLYGPYRGDMPEGKYLKVFIGCENVRPIMPECDWAFGVVHEHVIKHPRYMRFMRWGDDSHLLQGKKDWNEVLRSKTKFCAFLYSNPVPYREEFFRALSAYKHVDAPGRSMNNMPPIDPPGTFDWGTKIEFLRQYKFVVAFENSSCPGYNTEKLTHPVQADCVPIYWGDTEIGRSFNVRRFINAHDFLPRPMQILPRLRYRPHSLRSNENTTLAGRIARRTNGECSKFEQSMWARRGFKPLIDEIIRIDNDDALYLSYLREPLLLNNQLPVRARWIERWHTIFDGLPHR